MSGSLAKAGNETFGELGRPISRAHDQPFAVHYCTFDKATLEVPHGRKPIAPA